MCASKAEARVHHVWLERLLFAELIRDTQPKQGAIPALLPPEKA